jgi:hypothetical protein
MSKFVYHTQMEISDAALMHFKNEDEIGHHIKMSLAREFFEAIYNNMTVERIKNPMDYVTMQQKFRASVVIMKNKDLHGLAMQHDRFRGITHPIQDIAGWKPLQPKVVQTEAPKKFDGAEYLKQLMKKSAGK